MNVTDKDGGTYTCLANTTLDSVSASAVLTVVGKIFLNMLTGQWQSYIPIVGLYIHSQLKLNYNLFWEI